MQDERASRLRREVAALAASGLGVTALHGAALRMVEAQVGAELTCWAAMDPETLVISTMTSGDAEIPAEYEPLLAAAEYSASEPHTFAALARRPVDSATSGDLTERERRRSLRLATVWEPLGLDEELRVVFRTDGACWGAAGLARAGRGFTSREVELFVAVAPAIAAATRLAIRSEAARPSSTGPPAVVVIGADGTVRSLTTRAQEWRERFSVIAPDRFLTMMQVMATGARASSSGGFRARLRDGYGSWALLQASPLVSGDEDQVAITIEPATGQHLLGLLLAAYDLSARERDVSREVMAGHPTSEIAASLGISANTVQDHLKSIFTKVGVRSRGELVARLRPEGSAA